MTKLPDNLRHRLLGPSWRTSCSLLNLLFEDEDALPLLRGQHGDLFWVADIHRHSCQPAMNWNNRLTRWTSRLDLSVLSAALRRLRTQELRSKEAKAFGFTRR
ncbi:hypothetical protein INR49_013459 [Caranx melampygus]|nr:hypothetical protein INR49_013459 [Caranx melampygus]